MALSTKIPMEGIIQDLALINRLCNNLAASRTSRLRFSSLNQSQINVVPVFAGFEENYHHGAKDPLIDRFALHRVVCLRRALAAKCARHEE
jgi:hypothetical protein